MEALECPSQAPTKALVRACRVIRGPGVGADAKNPEARRSLARRGSTSALGFVTLALVTLEGLKHEQEKPRRGAVGADRALEAFDDRGGGEPSIGAADRPPRLGRGGSPSGAHSREQAEERCRAAAAPACAAGSDAADGDAADELSGGGGSDPLLRAGTLPVRADGDGLDARFHHHSGLHRADGRGGNPAHQRVRGGAGGGGEVGRPESGGGGHDGAGSGDPVAERDGIAGVVFQLGGGGEQARRPGAEGIRGESGEQAEGGQGEGAQVSSLRQDEAGAAGALEEMAKLVDSTQAQLGRALSAGEERLRGYSKVARAKAAQLHETMKALLPQIRYWLQTGRVATGKIINLHIPELYAIVRGKIGKTVEFGLQWGITRLRGGYLLATMAQQRSELVDARFAVRAVRDHIELFGEAPRAYAYDRAGHSRQNVAELKALGVRQVALAPRGRTQWAVSGRVRERLVKERAGGRAEKVAADLRAPNGPHALAKLVHGIVGSRLDILVANAGIAKAASIEDTTVEDFDALFAVNVRAPYFLVQQLLPAMCMGSSIVFVSSLAARASVEFTGKAVSTLSAYAATKGALDTLVTHFASALGGRGIRVNAVAPGVVETDMSSFARTDVGRGLTLAIQALKRVAQPDDVGGVVAFLASDEARWITGDTVRVDGGSKL